MFLLLFSLFSVIGYAALPLVRAPIHVHAMNFLSDVSAGGNDRYAPSFFELAAQEQLRDLLQPVVRYLLSVGFQAFIRKVAILMLRMSLGARNAVSSVYAPLLEPP